LLFCPPPSNTLAVTIGGMEVSYAPSALGGAFCPDAGRFGDVDTLNPSQRSERMSRIRSENTKPELIVRRLVFSLGYRYRLHQRSLPGCPDLVFPGRRKVVFIHGCFWHQHSDPTCRIAHLPKTKEEFWSNKLGKNVERDHKTNEALKASGWSVLTIWECQTKDVVALAGTIKEFLEPSMGG